MNFLDDDDLFYADHVECLVSILLKSKEKAAYSFGFETPVTTMSILLTLIESKHTISDIKRNMMK